MVKSIANLPTYQRLAGAAIFAAILPLLAVAPVHGQQANEDHYAALGLRAGSFLLLPEINLRAGYDDNVNEQPGGGESSSFSAIEGQVTAQSDWSRHSLVAALRGEYIRFNDVSGEDDGNFDMDATLTLDILRETQLALGLGYGFDTENDVDDTNFSADARLSHRFNRLTASIRGSYAGFDFGNRVGITLGSVTDDEVADYSEVEFALRLGYEVSPRLDIYGEISRNRHEFDQQVDANGFFRGSDGYEILAGADIEITDKLRGTVSLGYQVQSQDDPVLAEIRDYTYAADLTWFVTPLTNIGLNAQSDIGETVLAGSSGEINREITFQVNHALRRNIELTGSISYGRDEFIGAGPVETDLTTTFGISYLLNRNVAVTASYSHYEFSSTDPGFDYDANILYFGLRLRK